MGLPSGRIRAFVALALSDSVQSCCRNLNWLAERRQGSAATSGPTSSFLSLALLTRHGMGELLAWLVPIVALTVLALAVVVIAGLRYERKVISRFEAFFIDHAAAVFVGAPLIE